MDRAAKLAKIQDADSEAALGSVWGVSGPGNFLLSFFLIITCVRESIWMHMWVYQF